MVFHRRPLRLLTSMQCPMGRQMCFRHHECAAPTPTKMTPSVAMPSDGVPDYERGSVGVMHDRI
jgi:hypothetical protein